MIYVSSTCFNVPFSELIRRKFYGFRNIELSGNVPYSKQMVANLIAVQKKLSIRFLLHNYVPLFPKPYVINLASLNDTVYTQSVKHIVKALDVCRRLSADKYGFHAGYYCNMQIGDFGRTVKDAILADPVESQNRFIASYRSIQKQQPGVACYVENNVLTADNYRRFGKKKPFMLLTHDDYRSLRKRVPVHLLLDIGHLKITCKTLSLNFRSQLGRMISASDYIHVSDNDGRTDSNMSIDKNSEMWDIVRHLPLKGKTITLEVHAPLNQIRSSYQLFSQNYE